MNLEKLSCFLTLLLLFSCNRFPKDPENTLDKVKNGTMVVGYSENPPWVIQTDTDPKGVEPEMVRSFASTLNARVKWQNGNEQELFEKLEKKEIDLIVAGITRNNPWKKRKIGLTRPYLHYQNNKHVMAVPQGENAFIVRLENYLYKNKKAIEGLLNNPK